jgi:hypothetical protein
VERVWFSQMGRPRLALVIGTADYEENLNRQLVHPVKDAEDMTQQLSLAGFQVDPCTNPRRQVSIDVSSETSLSACIGCYKQKWPAHPETPTASSPASGHEVSFLTGPLQLVILPACLF